MNVLALHLIGTGSLLGILGPILVILAASAAGFGIHQSASLSASEKAATAWREERDAAVARADRKEADLKAAVAENATVLAENAVLRDRTDLSGLYEFQRETASILKGIGAMLEGRTSAFARLEEQMKAVSDNLTRHHDQETMFWASHSEQMANVGEVLRQLVSGMDTMKAHDSRMGAVTEKMSEHLVALSASVQGLGAMLAAQ